MRCPQCSERNSVAARKCASCDTKFPRKPVPKGLLFVAGGLGVAIAGTVLLSTVLPQFVDVEAKVGSVAKRVAGGPKSPEEAKQMKRDLDDVIKEFLVHNGDLKSSVLRENLKKALDRDAFEVHVIDLPRHLRVVEVDTLLQATPYLVMKGNSGTKVFKLNELEVFDDARIINDTAGPVLVVLGHSGQLPHRPQIRAYALLPDSIQEESEKVVPPILAEGQAKFASPTCNDIALEVSLSVTLQQLGFYALNPVNEFVPLRQKFVWKDARYFVQSELPEGPTGLLWSIAQVIRNPEHSEFAADVIGDSGVNFAKGVASKAPFTFARKTEGRNTRYTLIGEAKTIELNFRKNSSDNWRFVNGTAEPLAREIADAQLKKAITLNHLSVAPPPMVATNTAVPAAGQTTPVASAASSHASASNAASTVAVKPSAAPSKAQSAAEIRVATSAFGSTPGIAPEAATTKTPGKVILPHFDKKNEAKKEELQTTTIAAVRAPLMVDSSAAMAATLPPTATPPAVKRSSSSTSERGGRAGRATTNRNIRTAPTSRSRSIGTMMSGSTVRVLGKSDGWYKVIVNGEEGYVYGGVSTSDVPEIADSSRSSSSAERESRHETRESRRSSIKVAKASRKKSRRSRSSETYEDTGPVVINLDNPGTKVKIAHRKGKTAEGQPDFVP
jgi:uncharacterized protein YgiM (DUF1202 family)